MPYKLKKVGGGYKVAQVGTKKTFSKKPIPKARTVRQMRAILAGEK